MAVRADSILGRERVYLFHRGDRIHAAQVYAQVFLLVAEPAVPDALDIVLFAHITEVAVILRAEHVITLRVQLRRGGDYQNHKQNHQ